MSAGLLTDLQFVLFLFCLNKGYICMSSILTPDDIIGLLKKKKGLPSHRTEDPRCHLNCFRPLRKPLCITLRRRQTLLNSDPLLPDYLPCSFWFSFTFRKLSDFPLQVLLLFQAFRQSIPIFQRISTRGMHRADNSSGFSYCSHPLRKSEYGFLKKSTFSF